jgi:hypothetical protein
MTRNTTARLAGLCYLALVPTTGFAYGYVAFMPHGNPGALIAALESGRQTLEGTILIGAAGFIGYLVLAALLHQLLAPTSKLAADLMVLFVAASVPLSLAALAQRMDLLALLEAPPPALASEAMRLLQSEHDLFQVSVIFWGLWMIPLGWLVCRSGIVPRLIGWWLILGGFGYLSTFILPLLHLNLPASVGGVLAVLTVGSELAFMFWLIVRGAGAGREEAGLAGA